ncbi:MAG: sulfotransferase [Rhodanobacteraceae bacterium]
MTATTPADISAALTAGDLPRLEQICRAAIAEQPEREDAWLFLAVSLHYQGRLIDAVPIYRKLTELSPASSTHWSNYATALSESGLPDDAERAFEESIRLDPANAAPYLNLGLLLMQRREYLEAREKMLDAVERDPNAPEIRIHAATACCRCQDFDRAIALLKPWRQWLPLNDPAMQLELANNLLLLSEGVAAHELLEDLVRTAPEHFEARIQLSGVYERMNKLDDVAAVLDGTLAAGLVVNPERRCAIDQVRATLAARRGNYDEARALLENSGPRHAEDASHFFELAKVYDKLGETALAMQALASAHAIKAEDLRRVEPDRVDIDTLQGPIALPDVSAEDYRNWPEFSAPDTRNSPVFVVGFPRSGTTLLEQMLDAHPRLQSMDENPFFNRLAETLRRHDSRILASLDVLRQYDVDELRKRYLMLVSDKIKRRWDAQLVDKNPLNMPWLPFIHRLFPNAKYILAIRHPCDVLLSCYMQNFRSSILLSASANLERLARTYVAIFECWQHHVEVFQPSVLVSRYEDLVDDPTQQARRLADFLELEDAAPMLNFDQHARDKGYIGTPSYSQVIEPVNRKSLNRWVRYRPHFEGALEILEPMMKRLGYSADA